MIASLRRLCAAMSDWLYEPDSGFARSLGSSLRSTGSAWKKSFISATRVLCSASLNTVSPWRTVFSGMSSRAGRRFAVNDSPVMVPRSWTVPARRDSFCCAWRRIWLSHCWTNA